MDGGDRLLAAMRASPVLLDGGMGTRLIAEIGSTFLNDDLSRANVWFPDLARAIHARDIGAGSRALLTNTFGANSPRFKALGLEDTTEEVNRRGVELAREAAGSDRFVLGSMGPIAGHDSSRWYREHALTLAIAGVDALILETHTLDQAMLALNALVGNVPVPLFVSLWTWPDDARSAARRLEDAGAAAIGTNCGSGLEDVLIATERLAGAVSVPLIAKPSTGSGFNEPRRTDSPDDFARAVPRFVSLGVRLLGGCCGTDEHTIAAMRRALDAMSVGCRG